MRLKSGGKKRLWLKFWTKIAWEQGKNEADMSFQFKASDFEMQTIFGIRDQETPSDMGNIFLL